MQKWNPVLGFLGLPAPFYRQQYISLFPGHRSQWGICVQDIKSPPLRPPWELKEVKQDIILYSENRKPA